MILEIFISYHQKHGGVKWTLCSKLALMDVYSIHTFYFLFILGRNTQSDLLMPTTLNSNILILANEIHGNYLKYLNLCMPIIFINIDSLCHLSQISASTNKNIIVFV